MICQIRPWNIADAPALSAALNTPRVLEMLRDGLPCPYTAEDGETYIRLMAQEPFAFAVTVDDRAVGSIAAFRQSNIHSRTAEVGYYLAQEYWGKGIMSAALEQLCRRVFSESDILRLYAEPFSHNIGSCRVLEKCGFQLEGTLRCNAVKNGRVLDMKLYARIKE